MEMTKALELDSLARGAVRERFDHAVLQVVENILDPNTAAKGARTVTITLKMVPDENREMVALTANVATKLQPRASVAAILMVGHNDVTGEAVVKEYAPGANPGQHTLPDEKPRTSEDIATALRESGVYVMPTARAAAGGE